MTTFLAAALWFAVPHVAAAWESDVHVGLTRWLALQAGATTATADELAAADQGLDDGVHSAIHSVFHYACFGRHEADVSRDVRDDHFPSYAAIPGSPTSRAVQSASPAAKRRADDRIKNPGPDPRYETELFGGSLHTLQDSWSHEGVPDIPAACNNDVAWGHPATRHGWSKHDADLTYLWPTETTAGMAHATFDYLLAFLRKHPVLQVNKPKAWKDIAAEVDAFRLASTKAEKKRWFERSGFTDTSFLEGISLDDGTEDFAVRRPPRNRAFAKYTPTAPRDVVSFYESFFKDWALTYDFAALAANYIDAASLTRSLAGSHAGVEQSPQLVVQTLRLWRVRDHGKVAALGHTVPTNTSAPSARAALADDKQLAQYAGPGDAFVSLSGDPEFPYVIETLDPERRRYVALARFASAPYDTLAVVAEPIGGRLKIVDLLSVIDY